MTKRLLIIGALLTGILILSPLVVPMFWPWTEINCRHQDINIKTGKARYSRYLWFILISEEDKDTSLSTVLKGEIIDVSDIEPWHRVNTFSPGRKNSPHYIFHSALGQAKELELLASLYDLTEKQKIEIARGILTAWQKTGQDSEANEYLRPTFIEELHNPLPTNISLIFFGHYNLFATIPFLRSTLQVTPNATSALSICDWTCPLIVPNPHDMLDARLGFGTLAERTSKQPGKPGTQPENAEHFRVAAKNSDFNVREQNATSIDCHILSAGGERVSKPAQPRKWCAGLYAHISA